MMISRLVPLLALGISGTAFSATALTSETMRNGKSVYGVPNAAQAADRVVDVQKVKRLNVHCGETVTFQNGAERFTWRFDVVGHRTVDLKKVAPAGFTAERFLVHVSPNQYERP